MNIQLQELDDALLYSGQQTSLIRASIYEKYNELLVQKMASFRERAQRFEDLARYNSQSEQLTTSRTVAKSATSTNIARRWTSIQSGYYRNIMSQLSYRKKVYLDDDLLDVKGGLGCHPESSLKLAFVSREKQPQRASAQAH